MGLPEPASAPPTAWVFASRGTPLPKRLSTNGASAAAIPTKGCCGPGISDPTRSAVLIPPSMFPSVPPLGAPPNDPNELNAPPNPPPLPPAGRGIDATPPPPPPLRPNCWRMSSMMLIPYSFAEAFSAPWTAAPHERPPAWLSSSLGSRASSVASPTTVASHALTGFRPVRTLRRLPIRGARLWSIGLPTFFMVTPRSPNP